MVPNMPAVISGFLALAAVLALIVLATRAARLGGLVAGTPRDPQGLLAVRDVLILDPRRRLHLVRCDGRTALLLTGGPQDIVVGWLPEEEPAA
jgi:flagellar protein FliO/FliZ